MPSGLEILKGLEIEFSIVAGNPVENSLTKQIQNMPDFNMKINFID